MDIRSGPCVIYLFVLPTDTHRNRIINLFHVVHPVVHILSSSQETNPFMVSTRVCHQWVSHTYGSKIITEFLLTKTLSTTRIHPVTSCGLRFIILKQISNLFIQIPPMLGELFNWHFFVSHLKYIYMFQREWTHFLWINISGHVHTLNVKGNLPVGGTPPLILVPSDPILQIGKGVTGWRCNVKGDWVWGGASPIASWERDLPPSPVNRHD